MRAVSVVPSEVPPTSIPTASREIVFVAGGDVSFGREAGQRLLQDPEYAPLAGIERLWDDADLRFVNLESTLSDQQGQTQSPLQRLIFTGPPSGARALGRAGVHWVSTANNHAWDYGPGAFEQTLVNLDAAGVDHAGTGPDLAAAYAPIVRRVGGWSVALFAVTHVWNFGPIDRHEARARVAWASFKALEPILRAAREAYDVVIVSYHGGAEYQDAPSDLTRNFMKSVMSTGVDLVVGHHPHVLQGVGFFDGRPVFYSLGNLLFGRRKEHPWTRYGLLARVSIAEEGERSFAVCPYRIDDWEPQAELSDAERSEVLHHLRLASTATGGLSLGATDARGCVAIAPALRRSRR
ncbi:MAG TPA: CapA family protein [Polyangiaceae bacterium]|nr:CapA family protein [Polyangiaceae bacterium]